MDIFNNIYQHIADMQHTKVNSIYTKVLKHYFISCFYFSTYQLTQIDQWHSQQTMISS